jgi:nicotinic acid mononucleotide adenylyltransferase
MKTLTKEQVVSLVDSDGVLKFKHWYKNELHYQNNKFTVVITPNYRDTCFNETTLEVLLLSEDYYSAYVYEGLHKPWKSQWCKMGDDR